ncbi:peptidylprolyl isomerase [Thalassotalea sp. HSM 43]|uniref:SurA N-terminal domain-containing protein n=1 Tax=Thalassotalea sp. HSM 43 TaxID=2552945 RepID=UPI0010814A83|nr:SurA N-terminal domain-containing protein [Thalassotalea sp. HSM 43]QBY05203.1 peptidylprolyl isomerase [Thalassotalea sp. HSM 43]
MLERIREGSTGYTAKAILGLVILTFVFAGVGTYNNSVDTSVAIVNGEKITQQQFETAYRNQRARMEQQYGEMFAQLANNDVYMQSLRTNVLEQLINEELMDQQVAELKIKVGDEQIKQAIRTMPEFQVDGQFNNDRYIMLINQAGFYQPSAFRDYLRTDMARRQLQSGVMATEFSLPYQQQLAAKLGNQSRDVRYATIASEPFKATVTVEDSEISEYYEANKSNFAVAEQVKLQYVVLDIAKLRAESDISDADVEMYYEDNKASYSTEERRRASHILIEFADDEAAAEQQAQDLLAKIQAGEDFAELAKAHSADTFSGENGGDLDWFDRGVMDPAFEDAAFALTMDNAVSGVVKSDFGFHIIKLTDIEEVKTKEFAEVADEIREQLVTDEALEKFYAMQGEMATIAFESPDSLDEVATVANAQVQTSDWISRANNPAPFNNSSLVEAAFSDEVMLDSLNSDVIEVASDEMVMVVRLAEHKPATTKPLAEVSAQISEQLIAKKASEAAKAAADELVAAVNTGSDTASLLAANNAEFVEVKALARNGADVDRNIASQAFTMAHPSSKSASVASTVLQNGDYAVIQVQAVNEGSVEELDERMKQMQMSQLAQSALESYVANLKEKSEITRNLTSAPAQLY